MRTTRWFKITTVFAAAMLALTGCTAGEYPDDSTSIAVVEEFFGHLVSGEATAAAALTDIDFQQELVDDDFYAASPAVPTEARITKTHGEDGGAFSATVEYVLDDPTQPVTLDVQVRDRDGDMKISGWEFDVPFTLGPTPSAGVVTVNGQIEYNLADSGNELRLLPGLYEMTYEDPTGLTQLEGHDRDTFTVTVPDRAGVSLVPMLLPDVEPAVTAEIERLQAACESENHTGDSCPAELVAAMEHASAGEPTAIEWYRESGPDFQFTGGTYEATSSYLVHSDQLPQDVTVTFTGTVARDDSGTVTFTR